jgi:hypothetical protein
MCYLFCVILPDEMHREEIALEKALNFPKIIPVGALILQTSPSAPAVYTNEPLAEYAIAVTPLSIKKLQIII